MKRSLEMRLVYSLAATAAGLDGWTVSRELRRNARNKRRFRENSVDGDSPAGV